jgi:hypothetical protein
MANQKITPEEQLKRALKRKNRAIAAENRAKEQLRKAEQRVKYELGGLAVKAGCKGIDLKTLFGALCFTSAMLRVHPAREEAQVYFQRVGFAAWERFEVEKDLKFLRDLSEEERTAILSELLELIQTHPFPGNDHATRPAPARPSQQPQTQRQTPEIAPRQPAGRPLTPSSTHSGFDEEA